MGKIQRFSIVLMSPQIVFYPGQTVEGQVCVDLADDVKMKGIYISCISEGYAVWKVGKQVLRAKEDYLNLKLTLHGLPPNESGEVILPAGSHVFTFQFVLPNDLPGSYEGVNGSGNYVRHWLKATLDRPWKTNSDYRIMLCVAYVLDLNTIPDAEMPVEMKGKRDPSVVCCCYNGEITANFRIDKKGFVPGESIAIHGEVVDTMNIGINAVFVELIRKTLYKKDETGCHYDDLFLVTRLHHRRVAPGGSDLWNGEKLRIPPVAPSYLPGCNLIDLEYYLKVTVQLPGCTVGSNLVLKLPIIIGTVPLYSFVPQNMMVDSDNDLQQIQPVITQPQSCGLPYDMPPPSYQECIFGKVDASNDSEKHTDENCKKYAPLYPYYESMI